MVNHHSIAIAAQPTTINDSAGICCQNRRAIIHRNIHAAVIFSSTKNRMGTPAKIRGDFTAAGPDEATRATTAGARATATFHIA